MVTVEAVVVVLLSLVVFAAVLFKNLLVLVAFFVALVELAVVTGAYTGRDVEGLPK